MFKSFWGSQEQQAQPRPQEISTDSWYPPSVGSSPGSSHPATPTASSSGSFGAKAADRPHSLSHVSPAEAAGIIASLKDKGVDELRKLLSDKDAYHNFLLSLEPVKTQNKVRDELRNETLQLARENLEKEPRIMELRNQCRIIRTTELAAAKEKMHELERKKEDALRFYSPASLLHRLQASDAPQFVDCYILIGSSLEIYDQSSHDYTCFAEAMNVTDDESEALHRQLLDRETDLTSFIQKYKKMRNTYHKRALTHLAAKTSVNG